MNVPTKRSPADDMPHPIHQRRYAREHDQPEHEPGQARKPEVAVRYLVQARSETLNRFIQTDHLVA